jgi:glycosyltransferase involved in cell wall biosynthesis
MKKKVLFVHHSSTIGGAGLSGLNVLKSLNQEQYDITVYCTSDEQNSMIKLFKENGVNVIEGINSPKIILHFSGSEYMFISPFFLKSVYDVIRDIPKIKEVIVATDPDVVVMNSMTLFWIAMIAKRIGKETILFFRETYTKGLFGFRTYLIQRLINKYVDKVSFINSYENKQSVWIKTYKQTIYNAIDDEAYRLLTREDSKKFLQLNTGSFYILYVGGMTEYKGAVIAINAMKYISNPEIKLVFVGYNWNGKPIKLKDKKGILRKIKFLLGANYETNVINRIINERLQERILFFPNQKNIAPFYKACDCLIQPITKPHQARPVFEAGFSRIPVIITDFPQINELCDEENSYLFENKNSKKLAEKIMQVYNFPLDAQLKVENNYKRVVERHSFSKYKIQINKLFQHHT